MRQKMKKSRSLMLMLCFVAVAGYALHQVHANPNGMTGVTNSPNDDGTGCSCHSDNPSTKTTVTIASADGTTVFLPGQTYKFKVTIANSTYPYSGIDISSYNIAEDSLITGSGLRWDRYYRELTHSSPKSLGSSHAATWTFSFRTSKTPGADTLYAVGNATSGGGNGFAVTSK